MPTPTVLQQLLHELAIGAVDARSYSHKSMYFRFEPMMGATVLAVLAIYAGIVLGTPRKVGVVVRSPRKVGITR